MVFCDLCDSGSERGAVGLGVDKEWGEVEEGEGGEAQSDNWLGIVFILRVWNCTKGLI